MKTDNITIENKRAYFDYYVEDTLECGLVLRGNEVKSIRYGMCNLKGSWVQVQNGKLVIRGWHISKWDTSNLFDIDEDRERVLLAHKKEIFKIEQELKRDGITLIPLKVYFTKGKCKCLIGVCKGKHNYDKRECLKKKDVERDLARNYK